MMLSTIAKLAGLLSILMASMIPAGCSQSKAGSAEGDEWMPSPLEVTIDKVERHTTLGTEHGFGGVSAAETGTEFACVAYTATNNGEQPHGVPLPDMISGHQTSISTSTPG